MLSRWLWLTIWLMACGGVNTQDIDRSSFDSLSYIESPRYGFRVAVQGDVPMSVDDLADILDEDYTAFVSCVFHKYGIGLSPELALSFKYVIVPKQFSCPFHDWCGGEWREGDYIVLAFSTPFGKPIVFDMHEWGQSYRRIQYPEQPERLGCARDL